MTHQNGKASKEVVNEHNAADQVRDLQGGLDWFGAVDGRASLPLCVFYHNGGHVKLVLVSTMACLHGERLEEGNADADDPHCHAAADQQQEADAEAQADFSHYEATVLGIEALAGVVPAHSRQCGQDERNHPNTHHCVHSLLFRVAQPGEEREYKMKGKLY